MREDPDAIPARSRLDPSRPDYAEILERHRVAIQRRETTYVDPSTGYLVLTSATLRARGKCCEQGCRHCPFVED